MLVLKARCCKAASRSMMRRMLAGKLLDDRGNRMSPTWARKGSKRCRTPAVSVRVADHCVASSFSSPSAAATRKMTSL